MKKRKKMVIAIAIALAVACSHPSAQKEKAHKQLHVTETRVPYVPSAFSDVSLFPGNVFEFLINHL
jgi:hypothetical protein